MIFDLDDTLIVEQAFAMASLREAISVFAGVDPVASEPDALEAIRSVWRRGPDHALCLELGLASWEGLWSTFEGNHGSLDGVRAWAPIYRQRAWDAVAAVVGSEDPNLAPLAAERFKAAQQRGHPSIDGMESALTGAHARYRVGLLTNGSSDLQRRKLQQAGLIDAFDAVVVSGEVGVGKPAPTSFRLVLDGLGADPDGSVMVGDSWERDVVGALDIGMTAYWVADGRPVPASDPRVTVVGSIRELAGLLS